MTGPGGPGTRPGRSPQRADRDAPTPGAIDRAIQWVLLALHGALLASLVVAAWTLAKYLPGMPLSPLEKVMFQVGIGVALVAFGVRAVLLWRRLRRSGPKASR